MLVPLLVIAGCVSRAPGLRVAEDASTPQPPPPTPTTLVPITPTEAPAQLGEVRTYRDTLAGFALDYPAQWYLEDDALPGAADSVAYTVSLFSWDRASATRPPKDLNTLPDGAAKIDITVFNDGSKTVAEAVNRLKTQDTGAPVNFLKEENWSLKDGQEAVYLEAEGAFGVTATMVTLVHGKTLYLSGYGNLALFKAIALSLRAQ